MRAPRHVVAVVLGAAALLDTAGAAQAASIPFRPCAEPPLRCGTVTVPLDRSGTTLGTIPLRVQRLKVRGERRGTLLFLFGGPGQAGVQPDASFHQFLAGLAPGYEIVTFDQRGTGRSALLRCPALERSRAVSGAGDLGPDRLAGLVAGCANRLGPRRRFFGTVESVADIEAVRTAVGARKITLFGVSYGTFVATAYARAYPRRVSRLVLDSVVDDAPPAALDTSISVATRRVLRELCSSGRCRGVTTDPVADFARLQNRMLRKKVVGDSIGPTGRRTRRVLGGAQAPAVPLEILLNGDLIGDPARLAFPGAVRAALRGDIAPLMRLAGRPVEASATPAELSDALSVAAVCTDAPRLWAAETPRPARLDTLRAVVETLPASLRLGLSVNAMTSLFGDCAAWPDAASPPDLSQPIPAVPTLIVNGTWDLRTAFEGARRVARRIPRARIVAVPYAGHSPISTELCVQTAVRRFMTGAGPGKPCAARRHPGRAWPVPPTGPGRLRPVGAPGITGKTVAAVLATLTDVGRSELLASAEGAQRFPGLRSGWVERSLLDRFTLHRVVYVPGVVVSGSIHGSEDRPTEITLTVSGQAAAAGTLVRRGDHVVGRLGRVDVSLPVSTFTNAVVAGYD